MAQEIQEELFVGEVALKAFIGLEDRVLLSRDFGMTNWDSPGGRMHFNESPKEGLMREVKEEIGIDIEVGDPFHTDVFTPINPNKSSRPRFLVAYYATPSDPSQPFVLAPDEIEEARWFTKEEAAAIPVWDEYRRVLEVFFDKKG